MQRIDPGPLTYFDSVYAAFQRAQTTSGTVEHFFSVGGRLIRLCFAGDSLIPHFVPALVHLTALPSPKVDLTICLWDSASTGVAMPAVPWPADALAARGEIQGYNDGRLYTVIQGEGGNLHLFDSAQALAIYWLASSAHVLYWVSSFPFRDM